MYHKDLEVWKLSMAMVIKVYKLTKTFPENEKFCLTNQICRASVSIPSNIAEGCGRGTDKDTLRFLDIALGSSAELETQLLIAESLGYANVQDILKDLDKINALIYGLKKYLKQKNT